MSVPETQKPNPFLSSGLFMNTADVWTPFKASFEGFAGSGKSWTMYLMAIGIWEAEGKKNPVILIDTEKSAKFAVPLFRDHGLTEGENFFVSQSRSLVDFNRILKLANEQRAVLLIDSVTHLYEEMCRAFSEQKKRPVTYPQDALVLKPMWKEQFTNPFVNAQNCHIIFTGRAAWEYKMSVDDQGKKSFNAEGVKMRGDNETAFEPDLLVLMEREQEIDTDGNVIPYRLATIMKFRSPILDGKQFRNPTWKDFEPAYRFVARGVEPTANNSPLEASMGHLFQKGNSEAYFLQRQRAERIVEEISALYAEWGLAGTGTLEKMLRAILNNLVFQQRSTTGLTELHPDQLDDGKELMEYLVRFTAKNMELIEKMFKASQHDQLVKFLAEEKTNFNLHKQEPPPGIPIDDDVPEFSTPSKEYESAIAERRALQPSQPGNIVRTVDEIKQDPNFNPAATEKLGNGQNPTAPWPSSQVKVKENLGDLTDTKFGEKLADAATKRDKRLKESQESVKKQVKGLSE